jgi:hypothetical protein
LIDPDAALLELDPTALESLDAPPQDTRQGEISHQRPSYGLAKAQTMRVFEKESIFWSEAPEATPGLIPKASAQVSLV